MSPPHFAIVTKFCNGCTLYRHVHVSETHFDMGHVVDMVSQLSQGMCVCVVPRSLRPAPALTRLVAPQEWSICMRDACSSGS